MVTSKFDKIYNAISSRKTILGVGPMSQLCIDAVIEISGYYEIPIILIASRRQIDCENLGGGYVMSTEKFTKHINGFAGNFTYIARDHGSVWQGANERNLNYRDALKNATISYSKDIECGFDILHIDPSLKSRSIEKIIDDINFFLFYCKNESERFNREIIYEIGSEEHGGHITKINDFKNFIKRLKELYLLTKEVKFIVGNTGLFVKETQNIGKFNKKQTKELVKICNENNLYFKGHNTDYVDDNIIKDMLKTGVHSVNVAPEFGVIETKELLNQLRINNFNKEADRFLEISYNSGKYKKWMINNNKSKEEKAIIAGHYVFSNPEIIDMRMKINEKIDINSFCKEKIKKSIKNYLYNLGWEKELNI